MKRHILYFGFLLILGIIFLPSCSDDDEENKELTLRVASEQLINEINAAIPFEGYSSYFVKINNSDEWTLFGYIDKFEFKEGYEYIIKVWQEKWHNGEIADAPINRYTWLETISKEKKDSEDIPLQKIYIVVASELNNNPETNPSLPYYVFNRMQNKWVAFPEIKGFEYEAGYEYIIGVEVKFNGLDTIDKWTYTYVETSTKTKIDSENLPKY